MEKRGQVTIFIILGIVILALVLFFLYIKARVYLGPATVENLMEEFPPIVGHVKDCLIGASDKYIILIGRQGGYLDPPENSYRPYVGEKISYLCYSMQGRPQCINRMLRKQDMEEQLAEKIKLDLSKCLDVEGFKKIGYDVIGGSLKVDVDIGMDNVVVRSTFPITIKKEEVEATISEYSVNLNYPLGRLYESVRAILDLETTVGNFETLTYSVYKTKLTDLPYIIQKLQPYPDKLYILKIKDVPTKDQPYIFQFFIEGESS